MIIAITPSDFRIIRNLTIVLAMVSAVLFGVGWVG